MRITVPLPCVHQETAGCITALTCLAAYCDCVADIQAAGSRGWVQAFSVLGRGTAGSPRR